MPTFKPYNYEQNTIVVVNFKDHIQPGTFEFVVHYLVDNKLDLSIFYPEYQNDDGGRPVYDPALLLKIIFYVYYIDITSSRDMQWHCENNIISKAQPCDTVPHYTTIAAFICDHPQQIDPLFDRSNGIIAIERYIENPRKPAFRRCVFLQPN